MPVIRRTFVHIAGYYPLAPQDNYRRFQREYARSLKAWGFSGQFGPLVETPDWSSWIITTSGPNWQSEVEHILFRWDDIIEADRKQSWPARLLLSLYTFVDFIAHGALYRYARHAWRYAGFFLYPFVLLGLLYAAAYFGLKGTTSLSPLLAAILALPLWGGLVALLGKPLKLDHLLDDWNYGRAITRKGDPAVEARLQRLAEYLNSRPDEVLVVGHSFGAIWGAEMIARMIAALPEGRPIRFASVGASILKIGFHSASAPLRRALTSIAASPRVIWYDFNALNDVMNFHRVEPLSALGLPGKAPQLRNVRFRPMVSPDYYTKMQRNFFRLHNQFISGNDNRAPYDYVMLMCGPFCMEVVADSEEGAVQWFSPDGALNTEGSARI